MTFPRTLVALLSLLPAPLRRRLVLWMLRRLMGATTARPTSRRARLARRPMADLLPAAASLARATRGVLQTLGAQAVEALAVQAQAARMWAIAFAMAVAADFAALTRAVPSRVSVAPAPWMEKENPASVRPGKMLILAHRLERLLRASARAHVPPWLAAPPAPSP